MKAPSTPSSPHLGEAARFWEPRRLWYNGALVMVVLLWVLVTWPDFRPAFTLEALGKMLVLALLANLCYGAAYPVDWIMATVSSDSARRRFRRAGWILGMLVALVIENYWIADEIYPDITGQPGARRPAAGQTLGGGVMSVSNMNVPAPLAVTGFLAASLGLFAALAAVLIFWFARKPKAARATAFATGVGAVVYFALLLGFAAGSHETLLSRGQEKYFCEIDCHLAYSVIDVKTHDLGPVRDYVITLRTRFDETTTSPQRPRDAPLTPSQRELRLIDADGQQYEPVAIAGTSLMTPLTPASSYTTELEFKVPKGAERLRLLIETVPDWPDRFVIGDENSLGHKKTYFGL